MDTAVMNALQSARLLSPNISEAQLLAMASNLMKMNQQVQDAQESLFGTQLPTTNFIKPEQSSANGNNNNSINMNQNQNSPLPPTSKAAGGNGIKSYPCSVCQKVFWSQDQLSKHMTIHPTVDASRMFTCEICNKSFRFRSNLAEHRSVHTSFKPYVCKYCGKSSRLKGNLTKHILKHHKQEQNAYIGKDDIIVKKAPKQSVSITTSVLGNSTLNGDSDRSASAASMSALNGLTDDSSMMDQSNDDNVLRSQVPLFMPLGTGNYNEKSLLLSGHDNKTSEDGISMSGDEATADSELPVETSTPNPGTSPDSGSVDSPAQSRTPNTMMHMDNGIDQLQMGARCRLCQKHFRKRRNLGIHMTLKHGFPPQADDFSDQSSVATTNDTHSVCDGAVKTEMQQQQQQQSMTDNINKQQQQQTVSLNKPSAPSTPFANGSKDHKLDGWLTEQDNRLCRLEKQVETVLATMYTLVQLQTGMNQTLQRFKEDTNRQMHQFSQLMQSAEQPKPPASSCAVECEPMQQQALETPESVATDHEEPQEPEQQQPEQPQQEQQPVSTAAVDDE